MCAPQSRPLSLAERPRSIPLFRWTGDYGLGLEVDLHVAIVPDVGREPGQLAESSPGAVAVVALFPPVRLFIIPSA